MEEHYLRIDFDDDIYLIPASVIEEYDKKYDLLLKCSVNDDEYSDEEYDRVWEDFNNSFYKYEIKNISKLIIKDFMIIE